MTKHLPFNGAVEAVECPAILLHHQFGEEAYPRPPCGQSRAHSERDSDGVAYTPIGLNHQRLPLSLGDDAGECGNHRAPVIWRRYRTGRFAIIRWVIATATPAAACAGGGGSV